MYITSTSNHHLHQPKREVFNGISSPIASKQAKIDTIEKSFIQERRHLAIDKNPPSVDELILTAVHTQEYINYLKSRKNILLEWEDSFLNDTPYIQLDQEPVHENAKKWYYCSDTYTPFTKNIWEVAKRSYDAVHAAGLYTLKTGKTSYALTRPPGHHAMAGKASWYCYLANASILAKYISNQWVKIWILDIDYHHWNGAQTIFYDTDKVVTVSIHRDPADKFPYYTWYADEQGIWKWMWKNLNIPLWSGVKINEYIKYLQEAISYLQEQWITYMIVSLWFDILKSDPICDFALEVSDFDVLWNMISEIKVPTTVIQEWWYDIKNIGKCAVQFFKPFISSIE